MLDLTNKTLLPHRFLADEAAFEYIGKRAEGFDGVKQSLSQQRKGDEALLCNLKRLELEIGNCWCDLLMLRAGLKSFGLKLRRCKKQIAFLDKYIGRGERPNGTFDRLTASGIKALMRFQSFSQKLFRYRSSLDARVFETERDIREAMKPINLTIRQLGSVIERCCVQKMLSADADAVLKLRALECDAAHVFRKPLDILIWVKRYSLFGVPIVPIVTELRQMVAVALENRADEIKTSILKEAARENINDLEMFLARMPRHGLSEAKLICYGYKFFNELGDQRQLWRYVERLGAIPEKIARRTVAQLEEEGTLSADESRELLGWICSSSVADDSGLEETTDDAEETVSPKNQGQCRVVSYARFNGRTPFAEWLETLHRQDRVRVEQRIGRFHVGNMGDCKPIKSSCYNLYEARLHFGAHYRIYFIRPRDGSILLVSGGNKDSQYEDIKRADAIVAESMTKERA